MFTLIFGPNESSEREMAVVVDNVNVITHCKGITRRRARAASNPKDKMVAEGKCCFLL